MKFIISFLVFLIGLSTFINAYRILGVFPRNSRGDFILFENLMRSLADRGHVVNVVSFFPLTRIHPNYYDTVQLPDGLPSSVHNVSYADIGSKLRFILNTINTPHGNDVCNILGHREVQSILRNPPNDVPYDIVITEMFIANCFIVFGDMLKVPVVGVSTYGRLPWVYDIMNNPEGLDFVPQQPFDANHIGFFDRFVNVVNRAITKWSFNKRTQPQDEILKKHIGKGAKSIRELESSVALVLTNAHVLTHGPRPIVPGLVEVGGMHIADKYTPPLFQEIQKWLDESVDGVVYFNLGTDFMFDSFPTATIQAFYQSFKKLAPTRVLMRIEKPESLPTGLPENVLTVKWIQQLRVLSHPNVQAFITHGGIMGLQEAIYSAVPVIGIPLWGDQFDNVDVFVKKNIGIKLNYDDITEKTLDAALNYVLKNSTIRVSASAFSLAYFDRPVAPIDIACYSIEYVVRHGGNMLKLPQANLYWWQYCNIDIYTLFVFVLLLVTISILHIIRKVAVNIISRFRHKPKYQKLL